jgi:putative heme-binding domain-containing protein
METVLNTATREDALPQGVRASLFRTLREMVPNVPAEPIASWLEGSPNLEQDACVEAIRVLNALHGDAVPAAGPILAKLLADPSGNVRLAALDLARSVRTAEAKSALVSIAKNPKAGNEERRQAISALRGYEDGSFVRFLSDLIGTNDDAGFQGELIRALASLDFGAAVEKSPILLAAQNPDVRREAIAVMGQKPEGALRVVTMYNEGTLPPEDLPRVIEAVRSHATPEIQAATQVMLKNKLLAAPSGDEAARLREFVAQHGNPQRGREIFLDAKKGNCATCHRLEGQGGAVGPDLTKIWETLSFDKRVESILEPSKEIKEGFNTFRVATKDGKILSGLLLSDVAEGVTLKDAQGQEVRVPAAEIDEKGTDPTSLMPAGVVGHLSFEELADLLSFLGDRVTQESLRSKE